MKKASYSVIILLISLLTLGATSCADHQTPNPELPQINTLPLIFSDDEEKGGVFERVEFTSIGNQPIVEYGLLMKTSTQKNGIVPTLTDNQQVDVFSQIPIVGVRSTSTLFKFLPIYNDGKTSYSLYYRAYVKLANGTVIYGNTLEQEINIL